MNDRIFNMILDQIERLESLDESRLRETNNICTIKALYEDIKEIKEPGFNFLRSRVEQLMFRSGTMRCYVQFFVKGQEEEEEEFIKLIGDWWKNKKDIEKKVEEVIT